MSNHFTHLHLHTEFSLLDGALRISDLVKRAKDEQWKAVGISDHGNIFGAVKFFQTAQKEGIKPILGAEMYLTTDVSYKDAKDKYYHILVIVQNKTGYKNLCQLMAFAYQDGFYFKPRIDYKTLEKFSEGLIISTACLGGHIPTLLRSGEHEEARKRIEWFKGVFGPGRFFFELMPGEFDKQRELNKLLIEASATHDVPLIVTGDSHYLNQQDREAHEIMLAIQTKDLITNPDRYTFGEAQCYLRNTNDMLEAFPDAPQAVWNTGMIADSCDFAFEFGKLFFPQYEVPKTHTQESFFRELCVKGLQELKDRGIIPTDKYAVYDARLELEIDLIIRTGFVGYLLVVSDFIQWAKNQGIPVGPGRGSAAGSVVVWALKITNVDPLAYNLLFERFINPERVSMPDIDIDFCMDRREEVINYVKDKYGHDSVCQIITFGTMMAKGVIKDVARTLGFPFQDSNALTELIPDQLKITLTEAMEQEPKLKEMVEGNPKVKHLMDVCLKLEGLTRHASKHAAGVVISPGPLRELLPLYIPAKTTELVTQYAMTELESLGFLKMDFLGLKNLTVIDKTLKAVKRNHGITIDLDTLRFDDAAAFKLLCEGKTAGVFQFEGDGVTEVLIKLQPEKFEDLIAVNALYRPGPLGSGMVDDYINRRHGRAKTTYMFPELEPILSETYGVIVYQEQVMKIASAIAGYTLGGADILRRAMGKKKPEEMAKQKTLFLEGAKNKGFNVKKAEELFDLMAYFAGYGFNKSHSAAYALIAYHTAYLKAHYPREFMASLISSETSDPEKLTYYLQKTREIDIAVKPPSINYSNIDFTATNENIVFGLQGIKNVGHAALEVIMNERSANGPFKEFLEFCHRVDLRTVNKRVIESLICAGAFDEMPGNRAQKTESLETVMSLANQAKEAAKTGQMGLFGENLDAHNSTPQPYNFEYVEEWPLKERLEKEKAVAGFYLSAHPLDSYRPLMKAVQASRFADLLANPQPIIDDQEGIAVGMGLMQSYKVITTKKGDKMAFVELEDFSGPCEVIVFPKLFALMEPLLEHHNVFVVKGALDITGRNKAKIKAEKIIPASLLLSTPKTVNEIILDFKGSLTKERLDLAAKALEKGTMKTLFRFEENNRAFLLGAVQKSNISVENIAHLDQAGIEVQLILN